MTDIVRFEQCKLTLNIMGITEKLQIYVFKLTLNIMGITEKLQIYVLCLGLIPVPKNST